MSFLDGITSSLGSVGGNLVQLVALSYVASKMANNTTPANATDNTTTPNIDNGIRLQLDANADNKIPVLYGTAFFSGNLTDAQMTNNAQTMWYCLTLSEKTGTKLSDNQPSSYTFKNVYWNNNRIHFKTDGITVDYTTDTAGNIDRSLSGLVSIYCYAGNSTSPKIPEGYTNTATTAAYNLMPAWTSSTHAMNDLLFALVRVDYSRDKGVTGIGKVLFQVANSMYKPGDVLYDYMTNTRYGAGIAATEVYTA
jgi:hypothetical protein